MPCYKVCELLRAVAAVELATSIEEADSVVDVISVEEANSVVDVISVEKADSDVDAISLEGRASNDDDDDDDATSDEETSSDEKLVETSDCESREIAAAVVLVGP